MRTHRTTLLATVVVTGLMLTACSGADSGSLTLPSVPGVSETAPDAPTSTDTPVSAPQGEDVETTPVETPPDRVDPVTGETSDPEAFGSGSVQNFSESGTVPDMSTVPAFTDAVAIAGVANNTQASRPVAGFTAQQTQQAYTTLLTFLLTGARSANITTPASGEFADPAVLRAALDAALTPFTTDGARADMVAKATAVYGTGTNARTPDQQAYIALIPVGVCEETGTCLLADGLEFSDPDITEWTTPGGSKGLQIRNRQFYGVNTLVNVEGKRAGVKKILVAFDLTAGMVATSNGWQVAAITATNLSLKELP